MATANPEISENAIEQITADRGPHYEPFGWHHWPEHPWLSYQFRRGLGETQEGGGSVSEVMQAGSRMIPGDLARPALVFLHEGLGSVALWRDFPDKVAGRLGARALVYSRFGYGQSDGLPGVSRGSAYMSCENADLVRGFDAEADDLDGALKALAARPDADPCRSMLRHPMRGLPLTRKCDPSVHQVFSGRRNVCIGRLLTCSNQSQVRANG